MQVAATATPTSQPELSNTTFSDLFAPLKPVGSEQVTKPAETGSNSVTGAAGANTSGSAASAQGTVTAEEALAGTKHTTISGFSTSGTPGQPAPGMTTGANPSATVNLGGIVQGEWAVNLMDAILPALMVAAFYYFGVKIRKSEVQLTEKEKQTVIPVMQKCLDSIMLNFNNPWSALAWTLGGIYGGKLMEKGLVNWIDKLNETKQDEALKERVAQAEREANPAKHDYTNASADDIQNGRVLVDGQQPYTEQDIQARMKSGKCNREKAIKWLNKKYGL